MPVDLNNPNFDPVAREEMMNCIAGGLSILETARRSGYEAQTVRRLLKKPEIIEEIERRKKEAPPNSAKDEELALNKLRSLMKKSNNEYVQLGATKALLDWASRRKPKALPAPIIRIEPPTEVKDEEEAKKWRASS